MTDAEGGAGGEFQSGKDETAHTLGRASFKQKVTGADVNDEIRSLFKASSGFTGQLVRKRPPPFS